MRHTVGYDRWETEQEPALLESLYDDLRQRMLERQDVSFEAKVWLTNLYLQLNPAELRRRIDQKTAKLWKISR